MFRWAACGSCFRSILRELLVVGQDTNFLPKVYKRTSLIKIDKKTGCIIFDKTCADCKRKKAEKRASAKGFEELGQFAASVNK